MWSLFVCVFVLGVVQVSTCGMTDTHCTFYLTVKSRLTMWRGPFEKAVINDDGSVSILGQNGTIDPNDVILADGSPPKILTLVNDSLPGPTLTVYKAQNITIHVTNRLISDVISIHWHGQRQHGTPWMDGAGFITQCPILPGQTFTYNFIADTVGTHMYHSHIGGKIISGLYGAFIVKEKQSDIYPEHLIAIQDFHTSLATEDFKFRSTHGAVYQDGSPFLGYQTIDGAQTTLFVLTSFLINGRGRVYENGVNLTNTPFYVFDVEPNRTYRFRFINVASIYPSKLSVDGHNITVTSMDGYDVEHVTDVDSILSHSGERMDFLLHTNKAVGNYWIRLKPLLTSGDLPAYAILRYTGSAMEHPSTQPTKCTPNNKCRWINCPVEEFENVECINIEDILSADRSSSAPSVPNANRFKEFFINTGFVIHGVEVRAQMNGGVFQLPTVSALTQPHHVNNKCSEDIYQCGIGKTCECANVIDVNFGDVVQMNIFAPTFTALFINHPIHLHGYHFHVIKIGYRQINENGEPVRFPPDIKCLVPGYDVDNPNHVCNDVTWSNPSWLGGNLPAINLQRAAFKDTITVPAGGYVVIRFVADNPGLWQLHCHIAYHSSFYDPYNEVMLSLFVCVFVLGVVEVRTCGMTDTHCTFYLTVKSRLTMWRGPFERAVINDDGSVSILGQNGTIDDNDVILADGSSPKILTLVNDSLPGPTLTVYKTQNITIHVTNRLMSDVISIHWHGQRQHGTPWMDGAGFITQCPILPGQTFTYNFIADTVGTHMYHSHIGGKIISGLYGAFIVKEKQPDIYPEHVMSIQDYHNAFPTEEWRFRSTYVDVYDDGTPFMGYQTIDGAQTTLFKITSFLINGRGRVYENDANLTNTPLYIFDVEPNTTYRFRFINAASIYPSQLSVDGHNLTVISMDGYDVEHVTDVDSILSHSGERMDFLIHTHQTVGNYWIRLKPLLTSGDFPAYAILRYAGSAIENPSTQATKCTPNNKCRWINCPVDEFENVQCINIGDMVSVDQSSSAPNVPNDDRFKEIFINTGFVLHGGEVRAQMNGGVFQLPTVSALTQPHHVTNKCSEDKYQCGVGRTCECANVIDVNFGDVVQMNIFAPVFTALFINHPMHLHGYHFHVIKVGYRQTNGNGEPVSFPPDIDCLVPGYDVNNPNDICNDVTWSNSSWLGGNLPGSNEHRAPLKDTITVPAGGYVVIRFVADNPGLWHLHCHIAYHSSFFGMGMLINDSYSQIPAAPEGFPRCGSFPSPSFIEPQESSEECTSAGVTVYSSAASVALIVTVLFNQVFDVYDRVWAFS